MYLGFCRFLRTEQWRLDPRRLRWRHMRQRLSLYLDGTAAPGCSYHNGVPLEVFCESCGISICSKCKSGFHNSHGTVPLVTKSAENETTLKELLPVFEKREKEIADKLEELRKVKENFEKVEEKAQTQMQLQYDYIKLQLDTLS